MGTEAAIRTVAPALPPALVSPAALRRLERAGARLPLTTGGGFECHLGQPDRVDLAVRFLAEESAAAALALPILGHEWPGVSTVWLEYDLGSDSPSVFFGNGLRGPLEPGIAVDWIRRLGGKAPALLERAWPEDGWVGYIGLMLGRDDDRVRVTAYGLSPELVGPYLAYAGWPGDPAPATALVAEVAEALAVRLVLHLDVGEQIGPALGVELPPQTGEESAWQELFRRVGVSPDLTSALLAWPGVSRSEEGRVYVRRLNHLKLVFRGAAPPTVKGYLYYGQVDG